MHILNLHRLTPWFLLALLVLLVLGLWVPILAPGSRSSSASGDALSPQQFWSVQAQPYRGLLLRGISEDTPPSRYIRDVLAPAFAEETGILVEVDLAHNNYIERTIDSGLGPYDFVYVEQDMVYSYLAEDRLLNLSALLRSHPALAAPTFNVNDFTEFLNAFRAPANNDLYGVPIEAFLKIYLYRKDLFEDLAIQEAFFQRYHYPLAPAITFQQYRDIAAFFTEYGRTQGLELWGTTVQAAVGDVASFYEFVESILPAFGVYAWGINTETWRATVENGGALNSDQAKEALAFWVDMLQYAPPEASRSNWSDVAASFAAGRAAQGWVYGENVSWIATDPVRSKVTGKVGVALPPARPEAVEEATIGIGYIGYYDGGAFGIPRGARHPEAALLWLQYLGQSSVQPAWAVASGRVVHLSTFEDPLVQEQDQVLDGYYTLIERQGHLFAPAPPFPFHAQVRDVMAPYIHQAISGERTPAEALDLMAHEVDRTLQQLGYGRK